MQKLLRDRHKFAQVAVDALEDQEASLDALLQAYVRLLVAKLERTDKKADQLAAYEEHFERMKKMEKSSEARYHAGRIAVQDMAQMRYYRIEAEIWLERAKAKK